MHPSSVAWGADGSDVDGRGTPTISGWIMPAPLSMPAIRYVRPLSSESVRARNFGNVSVVINARAVASHAANPCPSLCARGPCGRSAVRILEIGSGWPMTPVDMTSVSDEDDEDEAGTRRASVARPIAHASARPCRPVTAFAQPLLTTRALGRPAVCSRTALGTVAGADVT